LAEQPFLAGASPAYADHIVMGSFMWARATSPFPLLEADDPIFAWRERMLDLFDGLARNAVGLGA
jgi:glutathione S-transferase